MVHPRVLIWVFLLWAAVFCGGCAVLPLSAESIDSQVVDAETRAPIEGAIVVAYWELKTGSITGDSLPCGAAHVEEAVTDKQGNFHLPGWVALPECNGVMSDGDPMLYVIKPGYFHGSFSNGGISNPFSIRTNDYWQHRQMKLKPAKDMNFIIDMSDGSYFIDFNGLETELGAVVIGDPAQCNWKKLPKTVRAVAIQENAFDGAGGSYKGLISRLLTNDDWFQRKAPECGSPKKFIQEVLQ